MQMQNKYRRGGALVMVMITVGLASVMAISLLSSASLQAQAGNNAVRAAQAEYLAESGVNLAMFYLQHPEKYSGAMPNGHYPGEANINMDGGSVATTVTWDAAKDEYTLSATATIQSDHGPVVRTVESRVKPVTSGNFNLISPTEALVTNGPVKLDADMTVLGNVRAEGPIVMTDGSKITGNVITDLITRVGNTDVSGTIFTHLQAEADLQASTAVVERELPFNLGAILDTILAGLFKVTSGTAPVPPIGTTTVPQPAYVPNLKTYRYKHPITGVVSTYSAGYISPTTLSNTSLGGTILNPAGIYWTDHPLRLEKVTIFGSLVMTNSATLSVATGASAIWPALGYPAVVSDSEIHLMSGADFSMNGLVYAKRVSSDVNATGKLSVDGVLMLYADSNVLPTDNYLGTVNIKYNSFRAQVGGFGVAIADTDIRALKVLRWTQN